MRYVNFMNAVGIEKPYFPASVVVSYAATGDESIKEKALAKEFRKKNGIR